MSYLQFHCAASTILYYVRTSPNEQKVKGRHLG